MVSIRVEMVWPTSAKDLIVSNRFEFDGAIIPESADCPYTYIMVSDPHSEGPEIDDQGRGKG